MSNQEIDITADSDDDEIEVVVVERSTINISQQEAIDLTDPDVVTRNIPTDVQTVIDLFSISDDDVTILSSMKPHARATAPYRNSKYADDVVIVESPWKPSKTMKASPKITLPRRDSGTKKRPHADITVSAPELVDLTEVGEEELRRNKILKFPDTHQTDRSHTMTTNQQPSRPLKQTCCTSPANQPSVIAKIDGIIASIHRSSVNSETHDVTSNKEIGSSSNSPRVRAIERSTSSTICDRQGLGISEETQVAPSAVNNSQLSSSTEPATSQSHNDDSSESEDYDTSDSQSTLSQSIDSGRRKKHKRNVVTPLRLNLRPRAAGKAVVHRDSVSNKRFIENGSTSDDSNSDQTEVAATSTLPVKTENITCRAKKNERPIRKSKTIAKKKMDQHQKSRSKRLKNASSERSRNLFESEDVTKIPFREPDQKTDQIDDVESADDSCTDDDSTASSIPVMNTEKDIQETTGIVIIQNWENLASRSNYQHYRIIDDMIANTKNQHSDCRGIESLPLVRAGESRFFAPRYSDQHKDLFQWVSCTQPQHTQPGQSMHVSIYLPCDVVIK